MSQPIRFLIQPTITTICAALVLCTSLAYSASGNAQTTVYNVLTQGKIVGKQSTKVDAGGLISVEYSYRDNGRGPDIFEKISVRADGQMDSFEATGKSTFGAPIDETFKRVDDKATWKSKADQGEQQGAASAVYVPVESSIEMLAIIARALLRAPSAKRKACCIARRSTLDFKVGQYSAEVS